MNTLVALVEYLVPPLGVLAWLWHWTRDRATFFGLLALYCTYHYSQHHLGVWYLLSVHTRWLLWAAMGLVVLRACRNRLGQTAWPRKRSHWILFGTVWLLAIACVTGVVEKAEASRVPNGLAHLTWPMANGLYVVVHGGATESTNAHHAVPAQTFALDVVRVNTLGFRAPLGAASRPPDYYVYGVAVLAPCTGEILRSVDRHPDQVPPAMDEQSPAGNFVAIHCVQTEPPRDVTVVLAHLKPNSILHVAGTWVREGQPLAAVGNSGNTSEPHLHIHAVAGRIVDDAELFGTGQAIPTSFQGRFLLRNDVVQASRVD